MALGGIGQDSSDFGLIYLNKEWRADGFTAPCEGVSGLDLELPLTDQSAGGALMVEKDPSGLCLR